MRGFALMPVSFLGVCRFWRTSQLHGSCQSRAAWQLAFFEDGPARLAIVLADTMDAKRHGPARPYAPAFLPVQRAVAAPHDRMAARRHMPQRRLDAAGPEFFGRLATAR